MRFQLVITAALLASPAWPQEGAKQQTADAPPSSEKSSEGMKGYGYGTQHGQESNAGARQSTRRTAKRSKAPQDEQGPASTRAAEQEGSAAGARSRAHAKPAKKDAHKAHEAAKKGSPTPPPSEDRGARDTQR